MLSYGDILLHMVLVSKVKSPSTDLKTIDPQPNLCNRTCELLTSPYFWVSLSPSLPKHMKRIKGKAFRPRNTVQAFVPKDKSKGVHVGRTLSEPFKAND